MSDKIVFTYIKNGNYGNHYANGVIGGLMPKGELQMDFFIERRVIPQTVTHEISEEGQLGKQIDITSKEGIIREIECGIIMPIVAAQALYQWLGQRIEEFQKIDSSSKKV